MAYKLKVKLSDVRYYYAGFPHDDEELEISVWRDGAMIPIGEVARVARKGGDSLNAQSEAVAAEYGRDFADKFCAVFSDDLPMGTGCAEIDEDQKVYSRLGLCEKLGMEEIRQYLEGMGIEMDDLRSECSKRCSRDLYKLYHGEDDASISAELTDRETNGSLTRDEVVKAICDMCDVCADAAGLYLDMYCTYRCRQD